jgi:hypothetical protein
LPHADEEDAVISRVAIGLLGYFALTAGAGATPELGVASAEQLAVGCRKITDGIASTPTYSQGLMVGRCQGLIDTLSGVGPILPQDFAFCVPRGTTQRERSRVYLQYIDRHQDLLQQNATKVMFLAFHEAWPCE